MLLSTKIIAIYARNPLYSRVASNYNCSGARFQRCLPRTVEAAPSWGPVVSSTPPPLLLAALTALVFPFFACARPRSLVKRRAAFRQSSHRRDA